jgi:hypothetical protein
MSHVNDYSEDALVEKPAIALFAQLGWQTASCFEEVIGPNGTLGRETSSDVVLRPRLQAALIKLNPEPKRGERQPSPHARPVAASAGFGRIGRGARRGADARFAWRVVHRSSFVIQNLRYTCVQLERRERAP